MAEKGHKATKIAKEKMVWTEAHDILLARKILFTNPFSSKKGSQGRGKLWQQIAETLNGNPTHKFSVDDRGVKERYTLLKSKFNAKMAKEIKASGISPEISECTKLIAEVIDLEASTASLETGKQSLDPANEKKKAEDIRLKAMETMGDTKNRQGLEKNEEDEDEENVKAAKLKRVRRNANETSNYLKTKNEAEVALRKEEMQMKMQQQHLT